MRSKLRLEILEDKRSGIEKKKNNQPPRDSVLYSLKQGRHKQGVLIFIKFCCFGDRKHWKIANFGHFSLRKHLFRDCIWETWKPSLVLEKIMVPLKYVAYCPRRRK